MQKSECVGCKTHFQEGTKLPLEGLNIELKNYPIPIKDMKHKWVMLKTICALLNSKGGTIFIGAQDQTGQVKGVSVQRKDQDDFKIFIQQLTDRIQPKVDLSDRQDINIQFVPVLTKGKFMGKYLIKILVRQGQPSQLYCFSQKLQLLQQNDKKMQEFEIVYSYKRMNTGNIKQFKGYQLVAQAKARAAKPVNIINCFHDNCNPQPVNLTVQILKLGFSGIASHQIRQILQQWFQIYLEEMQIYDSLMSWDKENDMVVIEFNTKKQFDKVQQFINKNLQQLNSNLVEECCFCKKDAFLDCILYQNTKKQKIDKLPQQKVKKYKKVDQQPQQKILQKKQEKKQSKKQGKKQLKKQQIYQNKVSKQKSNEIQIKKQFKKVQTSVSEQGQQKQALRSSRESKQEVDKQPKQKMSKRWSIAFTHINPKMRQELIVYLQNLLKCKKQFSRYQNTVQVFLPNQELYNQFYQQILQQQEILNIYGFKNQIKFGTNTGYILIQNYDKQKGNEFQKYLKKIMGKELKATQFLQAGQRVNLGLLLNSKQTACEWLDKLLIDKQVKNFKIPGAQKGEKAKMKIFLICQQGGAFVEPEDFVQYF